jgi:hypothetical protein
VLSTFFTLAPPSDKRKSITRSFIILVHACRTQAEIQFIQSHFSALRHFLQSFCSTAVGLDFSFWSNGGEGDGEVALSSDMCSLFTLEFLLIFLRLLL